MREAQRQLQRIGMGEMHELAGNLALGPQRLMEIAARCAPTDAAAARQAGRRPAPQGEAGAGRRAAPAADEGMSILLVEHDMDLVMGLVDRVVVMEFGTKLIEGTPEEVQVPAPPISRTSGARRLSVRNGTLTASKTWAIAARLPVDDIADLHAGCHVKTAPKAEVLHGLNLQAKGQRGHVIGPNGAGKSTRSTR